MQDLYNEVVKLLNQLIRSNKDAMSLCQQWVYNGHKRYYQMATLCLTEHLLYFKKKAYDRYTRSKSRFLLTDETYSEPYKAGSYKEHFTKWENYLQSVIESLEEINNKIIAQTSRKPKGIKAIFEYLDKDMERTVRDIQLFDQSGWNPIELHAYDKSLHTRLKKEMKKAGYK